MKKKIATIHKYIYVFLSSILFILILIVPQIHNSEFVNATISSKTIFFSNGISIILSVGTILFFFSELVFENVFVF